MKNQSGLGAGLLSGLVNILAVLLGLTGLMGTLVQGWFDLPSQVPGAWVVLLAVWTRSPSWAT